ncbi:MAG TPA: Gfo/Idh/MocA family oxidoreductase [Thermoflexia bacterium]|nr:Gfo/Idh/MocA family oxidoreductase [Thermoflexia bacterium]
MLKVGLLGLGMMGSVHATQHLKNPHVQLVAVADKIPSRLNSNVGVRGNLESVELDLDLSNLQRFAEADELLATADVDLIDVCLPTYLHQRYTIAALQAGHHVLCEKPMALTVAEADAMLAAAQRADRQLMIAQCIRFWPEYRVLRRYVQEGPLGALLSLNMYRVGGVPGWSERNWYLDPALSGGMILDLHIHDVDYVNSLLGIPDIVQASGKYAERGGYHIVHADYIYREGPHVHLHAGWSTTQIPFTMGFDAWFADGFLRYDSTHDPTLQLFTNRAEVRAEAVAVPVGDAYYHEIDYFVTCLEQGRAASECPPRSARDSVALVQREIRAIQSQAREL